LKAVTYCLVLSAVLGAASWAAEPPGPSSPPVNASAPSAAGKAATDPGAGETAADDDFFEFLGTDDVGDADLLEMLKNSPPTGRPPAPPPSDSRQ
jgi:hypothetical protein